MGRKEVEATKARRIRRTRGDMGFFLRLTRRYLVARVFLATEGFFSAGWAEDSFCDTAEDVCPKAKPEAYRKTPLNRERTRSKRRQITTTT